MAATVDVLALPHDCSALISRMSVTKPCDIESCRSSSLASGTPEISSVVLPEAVFVIDYVVWRLNGKNRKPSGFRLVAVKEREGAAEGWGKND